MCKSAGVIHEFLPASEILRVAEAVLRVFKQLGDYEHKQRNRMKFMIKDARLGSLARGIRPRARRLPGRGACRSSTIDPPGDRGGAGVDARRRAVAEPDRRARRRGTPIGPGITPTLVPVYMPGRRGLRALARDQRPAAEAVRLRRLRRRRCRSAT